MDIACSYLKDKLLSQSVLKIPVRADPVPLEVSGEIPVDFSGCWICSCLT